MNYTSKHDATMTMAGEEMIVSEVLLQGYLASDPICELLTPLLEGGGDKWCWFAEVAEIMLHSVVLAPGCFVRHQQTDEDENGCVQMVGVPCLALVSRILTLRDPDNGGQATLFVVLSRMPGIPLDTGSRFVVSADDWALYAADPGLREDAYVVFETLCITVLDRHPLDGAWLFLTA